MRVLSQESLPYRDLPYNNTVLFIENGGKEIKALSGGIVHSMAVYSTEEKAKKAMDMLRLFYENTRNISYPSVYFQFPIEG